MRTAFSDRRRAIRLATECTVRLRLPVSLGRPLHIGAIAVRLSTSGMYMYVTFRMYAGARLFTVVPLPTGARVALRGYVTRVELRDGTGFGVAVRFTRTRLLPAAKRTAEATAF